jgi:hypothetical protein
VSPLFEEFKTVGVWRQRFLPDNGYYLLEHVENFEFNWLNPAMRGNEFHQNFCECLLVNSDQNFHDSFLERAK